MKKLIVFTVDRNYLPHLATALTSFLDFHRADSFEVGLLYSDISDFELEKFFSYFSLSGLKIYPLIIENKFSDINVGYHFNQIIFYRLLAPELFSEYDRILYLDSDIIFVESISDIFDLDMNDKVLGAIDKTQLFGVPSHLSGMIERYLASGLLLIDTKKYIENKVKDNCFEFLKTYRYEMPDQDALSYVVQDFMSIDPSYSVETAFLGRSEPSFDFAKNPKIIQFSGSSKPWHLNDTHPYKNLYWKYRNKTPYRSFFPDDFRFDTVIRYVAPKFARDLVKKVIRKGPQ